jgi:hypothetical protein
MIAKEMGFVKNPKGFQVSDLLIVCKKRLYYFQRFLNAYLFTYLSRQFGGAWLPRDITPLEIDIPTPSDAEILSAVDIIQKAERPVLLLGSQAVLPPVKPHDLQALVTVSKSYYAYFIIFRNLEFRHIWAACAAVFWAKNHPFNYGKIARMR